MSRLDLVVECLAALGVLTSIVLAFLYLSDLSKPIPVHFRLLGRPDRWAASETWLLILPLLAVVLHAGLTGAVFYVCRIFPTSKALDDPEHQYRITRSALVWLKAEIVWFLAYTEWKTIQITLGNAEGLGAASVPVFVAVILGTVGVFTYRAIAPSAGKGELRDRSPSSSRAQ